MTFIEVLVKLEKHPFIYAPASNTKFARAVFSKRLEIILDENGQFYYRDTLYTSLDSFYCRGGDAWKPTLEQLKSDKWQISITKIIQYPVTCNHT